MDQPPTEDFFQRTRRIQSDTRRLAQDLQALYDTASNNLNLRQTYRDNPYAVLGVALGVGYVLGGGLFTPFTMRALKIGTRAFAVPLVLRRLQDPSGPPNTTSSP